MRINLRIRPEHAPGILAGMVQANLLQIQAAHAAGQTPVLDGLLVGGALRRSGVFPKTPAWQAHFEAAKREGSTLPIYYERLDETEDWRDWARILVHGFGDCEDLAPAVAAELLAAGIPAVPLAYQPQPEVWHVVVRYARGAGWRDIDPSVQGGMLGVA